MRKGETALLNDESAVLRDAGNETFRTGAPDAKGLLMAAVVRWYYTTSDEFSLPVAAVCAGAVCAGAVRALVSANSNQLIWVVPSATTLECGDA